MKLYRRLFASCAAILAAASISMTALATAAQSPADALSGLTGKTVEEIAAERSAGKSYASIADDAGKLAEFRAAVCDGTYHDECGYGYNHAVCGAVSGTVTGYGHHGGGHHGGGHHGCRW